MANNQRGEIEANIGGEMRVLCLTLGALAELEGRLQADDLIALGEKFASGRVSAKHLIAILGAGLRGGGNNFSDDQVAKMTIANGLSGAAKIAADLLNATFSEVKT